MQTTHTLSVFVVLSLLAAVHAQYMTTFASLGDWGAPESGHAVQKSVATIMPQFIAKYKAEFLLALGDNFYEDGVASDTDPQWKTSYTDIYNNKTLQIPWYAILGNHDEHLGRGQGEIDYYLNRRDSRWIMPARWYTKTFTNSEFSIQFVFIDTVVLSFQTSLHLVGEKVVNREANMTLFADFQSRRDEFAKMADDQWTWIENTIKASKADWLIVAGHYPVYSGGEHGNTPELIRGLLPKLAPNKVNAFLCGHDHTLQHLRADNVDYWVSGNGGKIGTIKNIPQSLFGVVDPGFMIHQINRTHMTTRAIDHNAKEVYTYTSANTRLKA